MRLDGVEDGVVLGADIRYPTGLKHLKPDNHQTVKLLDEGAFDSRKPRVACHIRQRAVEVSIVFEELRFSYVIADDIAEPIQRSHRSMVSPSRPCRASRRDDETQAEQILDVARRDWVDPIPLPRQHCHKLLLFETKQRVPDR